MELNNFLEKAEDYFISHFAVDLLVFAVVIAIIVIIIVRRHKKNEAKKSLNNIITEALDRPGKGS
ncbi:MAG TPA: hypothetical protein VL576_00830 [Candidatus Paceibacterota bacterium]|nr:hypothetical protein [Candidatus Paceibacterota bacterium]